ncbi:hypothetical protein [Streptomyces sp. NPDC086989]|uniref:hypothetical protein n=1 Tax=Streptomyces sp. NPDC086989 TaxID=3365764 RepID=UPI0037F51A1B
MAVDVIDTVRLVRTNRLRDKRLLECDKQLDQQDAEVEAALLKARQTLHDDALAPFRDVFQRLQHADPIAQAAIERPTAGSEVDIEPRWPRRIAGLAAAVGVALAGGALLVIGPPTVGRAVTAGAKRAVEAFGSASTGRAIKTLHGAAKSAATEAWFGRGPVAAGGGGRAAGKATLSKIRTTSADLAREAILKAQLQALDCGQHQKARELDRREAETKTKFVAAPALHERSKDMQRVVQEVRTELVERLPAFTALVETCNDFSLYDSCRRGQVAAMIDLDGLAAMVLTCPVTDAEGRTTEESERVVVYAEARLRAMRTEA